MTQQSLPLQYFQAYFDEYLSRYQDFLRIPSVSTDPEHKADMERACDFLVDQLTNLGTDHVEIFPTPMHPILFAEKRSSKPNAPTLLIYGHYDVQPVAPLDEWKSPPFDPTLEGDYLIARGASGNAPAANAAGCQHEIISEACG